MKNNKFFGYWVVAVSSPWMTAENPFGCKVKTFEDSVFSECLKGILRTCGSESASRRSQRRYACLIKTYQKYEWEYRCLFDEFPCPIFHFLQLLCIGRLFCL